MSTSPLYVTISSYHLMCPDLRRSDWLLGVVGACVKACDWCLLVYLHMGVPSFLSSFFLSFLPSLPELTLGTAIKKKKKVMLTVTIIISVRKIMMTRKLENNTNLFFTFSASMHLFKALSDLVN